MSQIHNLLIIKGKKIFYILLHTQSHTEMVDYYALKSGLFA